MKLLFKNFFIKREVVLFLVIVLLFLVVGLLNPKDFFSIGNFKAYMTIISVRAIVACGMTVLMISGGFDMSVGGQSAMLGIILGIMVFKGMNTTISVIITIIFGVVVGLVIGFIVSKLKVNPFMVTLGGMFLFSGLAIIIAFVGGGGKFQDQFVTVRPLTAIHGIAGGSFHGVEYIVFYMVGILIISYIFLKKNKFLRQNFYIGSNENAARLVGIKVDRLKIINYALVGLMVAIAAILKVSRYNFATAVADSNYPLEIIASVIIGGASLSGGEGSIIGSFLGVCLLTLIYNSTIILGINPAWYTLLVGVILLMSVLYNEFIRKKFVIYKN